DRAGVAIGPLTDQPQPAPPLPTDLSRLAGRAGAIPEGWSIERGTWQLVAEGLRQADRDAAAAVAWRGEFGGGEARAAGGVIRLPELGGGGAGLALGAPGDSPWSVTIEPVGARCRARGPDGGSTAASLPTLGAAPFDFESFHALEVRARNGRAEVRVDG